MINSENDSESLIDEDGFEVIREYRSHDPSEELRSNPMALVFPLTPSDALAYEALFVHPRKRPADFRTRPLEERKEWLDRMNECHYPFQGEIGVLQKVSSLVRMSLAPRHPGNPAVMAFILKIAQGREATLPRMSDAGAGGGLGLLLTGPSGTGKSCLIDRVVRYFGRHARIHLTLNDRPCRWAQLGVIRISAQTTWAGTLEQINREIDRQLGRNILSTRSQSLSATKLQPAVWAALTTGFAPLLIIDEFQRLRRLHPSEALKILEGLIDLMQDGGLPVIVVGTVKIRHLLRQFPSEMSKFSNAGGFEFERLKEGDDDTENFILLLKDQHVSCSDIQYSAEFSRYLVLHGMGVRRIIREFVAATVYLTTPASFR
ncbi:ATP-binding protein [Rhodoferax sp.]|uniref:ATP-binding protein n=1 Tax=Rhodoferax sp. TaxID=50421 RepID=UPI00374D88F6